jgi:murein DD-endopeptidase MepM/ murein hydrolase activator NlpD
MTKIKYHYNSETCQYEHARISIRNVLSYVTGLFFTALFFLAGLLYAHNQIVETDREKVLRAENSALKKNKTVLEHELGSIELTLIRLQEEDKKLYTRLFNAPPPETPKTSSTISKEQVLLADASGFRSLLDVLKSKSSELVNQSANSNKIFADQIHVSKSDIELIASIPSIQPLLNPQLDKLVSGFGNRVNPFHKGMHHHPGADFAAPRGTEVLATAAGKVTDVNRSVLQAGYGNYIEIDHGHGFVTRYAHLEDILVKRGQTIAKGTVIATVGNSGGSIAPHVHYEIIRDGEQVDPILYMVEGLTSQEHGQLVKLSKKQNQSLD